MLKQCHSPPRLTVTLEDYVSFFKYIYKLINIELVMIRMFLYASGDTLPWKMNLGINAFLNLQSSCLPAFLSSMIPFLAELFPSFLYCLPSLLKQPLPFFIIFSPVCSLCYIRDFQGNSCCISSPMCGYCEALASKLNHSHPRGRRNLKTA